MDKLTISKQEDTPEILFNPKKEVFLISGRSWPENAHIFYEPVVEWLAKYIETPNSHTLVEFKLEYFNTPSAKKILDILALLKSIEKKGKKISINWYYDPKTTDLLESGQAYSDLLDLPFNYVPYSTS